MRVFKLVNVKSKQFAEIVRLYYPRIECQIIPNTLSSEFLEIPETIKQVNKLAFVGTICDRKGFHVIRKALELIDSQVTPLEFHVYGDGGDVNYISKEINLIQATGHQLFNHGCVDAKTLAVELTSTNLLIAPSYAETFGNQVIEAMLCRCHCIVSDDTGMSDNVRKYGHGTIVPQQGSAEIAKTIEVQMQTACVTEEMKLREDARAKVINELGPGKIAAKLSKTYIERMASE